MTFVLPLHENRPRHMRMYNLIVSEGILEPYATEGYRTRAGGRWFDIDKLGCGYSFIHYGDIEGRA